MTDPLLDQRRFHEAAQKRREERRRRDIEAALRALRRAGVDLVDETSIERVLDELLDQGFERGCRCYPEEGF